ncbi:hypothetical protein R3P38DRAFT_2899048 [Favolaschia claudopus]|uniref:Uncharacterized protein n=1 Tax=Favolaschia claudopus TaxID=2862362 RepID=A0AAW0CLD3_9AGAR
MTQCLSISTEPRAGRLQNVNLKQTLPGFLLFNNNNRTGSKGRNLESRTSVLTTIFESEMEGLGLHGLERMPSLDFPSRRPWHTDHGPNGSHGHSVRKQTTPTFELTCLSLTEERRSCDRRKLDVLPPRRSDTSRQTCVPTHHGAVTHDLLVPPAKGYPIRKRKRAHETDIAHGEDRPCVKRQRTNEWNQETRFYIPLSLHSPNCWRGGKPWRGSFKRSFEHVEPDSELDSDVLRYAKRRRIGGPQG